MKNTDIDAESGIDCLVESSYPETWSGGIKYLNNPSKPIVKQ